MHRFTNNRHLPSQSSLLAHRQIPLQVQLLYLIVLLMISRSLQREAEAHSLKDATLGGLEHVMAQIIAERACNMDKKFLPLERGSRLMPGDKAEPVFSGLVYDISVHDHDIGLGHFRAWESTRQSAFLTLYCLIHGCTDCARSPVPGHL